jgi:hypothetical protein
MADAQIRSPPGKVALVPAHGLLDEFPVERPRGGRALQPRNCGLGGWVLGQIASHLLTHRNVG